MLTTSCATTKRNAFAESLPIVAAALGRLCGVTVELGASTPCTDGSTIYLPLTLTQSEEEELQTLGILMHEAGHIRMTDFAKCAKTPLEKAIDNALEDTRVEAGMARLYPGAEYLFEKAHAPSVQKLMKRSSLPARSLVPLYLLVSSQREILRRAWLAPLEANLTQRMRALFPEHVIDALRRLALSVKDAQSTQDVTAIRRKVVELLKQQAKEEEKTEQSRPMHSDTDAKDEAQADADADNGDGTGGDSTSQSKSKNEADGTPAEEQKEMAPTGESSASANAGQIPNKQTPSGARAVFAKTGEPIENPMDLSAKIRHISHPLTNSSRTSYLCDLTGRVRPLSLDPDLGRERLARARLDSITLRRALTGLVASHAAVAERYQTYGRRLATDKLARLVTGNPRVFVKRVEHPAPNAAVHILLDMSGSMGLTGGDLAVRASLGLIAGLESIRGVSPALTVFPGQACGQSSYAACTVLPHGKRLSQIPTAELGGIEAWGGTPLAQALQVAAYQLGARKEARKAVFLVTDGAVQGPTTRQIVNRMISSGIEVFGIQIGCIDDMDELLKGAVHIENIDDLVKALFVFAKKLLA